MAKQDQIPTTEFVPVYPKEPTDAQQETWLRQVAGFCNGSQAVKQIDNLRTVRTGNVVYVQGTLEVSGGNTNTMMPVVPRIDGFLTVCASDGTIKGVKFTSGNKTLDFTGFADGTYMINGSYLANQKEN